MGPLALLTARAPEFGARVLGVLPQALKLEVMVPMPDGTEPAYAITATLVGGSVVTAKESVPAKLPSACPDRHINSDGSFCLGWDEVDRIEVVDEASAFQWWAVLVAFLRLQERADRRRRWPSKKAWAHGSAAAHQQKAMQVAEKLGLWFTEQLEAGALAVVHRAGKGNGPAIRVFADGRRLYDVWLKHRRVVNLRGPCVCPAGSCRRPTVFRSCGDHARAAADLALALHEMRVAEARFWKSLKGQLCCGTIDDCPLAEAA